MNTDQLLLFLNRQRCSAEDIDKIRERVTSSVLPKLDLATIGKTGWESVAVWMGIPKKKNHQKIMANFLWYQLRHREFMNTVKGWLQISGYTDEELENFETSYDDAVQLRKQKRRLREETPVPPKFNKPSSSRASQLQQRSCDDNTATETTRDSAPEGVPDDSDGSTVDSLPLKKNSISLETEALTEAKIGSCSCEIHDDADDEDDSDRLYIDESVKPCDSDSSTLE